MMINPENLRRYTVGVLVSNEPGVLSRVSGLFSRRGFNIESLAVGPTQDPEVSRITIAVLGDDAHIEQACPAALQAHLRAEGAGDGCAQLRGTPAAAGQGGGGASPSGKASCAWWISSRPRCST